MDTINFSTSVMITKPAEEVYRAVADNTLLCEYFTSKASAPIKAAGDNIRWSWNADSADIKITEVVENEKISFSWPGYNVDYDSHCTFEFTQKDGYTIIKLTEKGWRKDDEGIVSALANCAGWESMLCNLKAWIMYGIDLRK